ncbi:Hypothetical predicted protein [Pelobates cultripes]|uniref:Uncharacterized protein n=1 Tax=Pelobates cultripes TaxID=61616 RepID=A0AAD1R167_PELCU|nr:Hypothetical predicted protein [Pelobates cultripes]
MDHYQLRDYICNFRLDDCARGNQGYNRVLLQLFGYTGHGMSSFINSCKFVLDGEYKMVAESGAEQGGITMVRRSYELTDTITIVDNRGFAKTDVFKTLTVCNHLGNFQPLNNDVEWSENYSIVMEHLEKADMDPNYSDLIVPIFIFK